ncbi:MAG: GNAT family N-acetyltransferase [Bacilli bacterium]|nr:GNAT family N-acetyltransferase [Bacilli bacterium]
MKIIYYEDKYLDSLNVLLKEAFNLKKVYKNISDNIELLVVFNDEVIGYLNLNKNIDMITGENYFYVNYVCVKKSFRRLGVAKKMFMEVFSICLKNNIKYLELTSNDSRVAAHKLYESLGFSVRETNVFRKEIL